MTSIVAVGILCTVCMYCVRVCVLCSVCVRVCVCMHAYVCVCSVCVRVFVCTVVVVA